MKSPHCYAAAAVLVALMVIEFSGAYADRYWTGYARRSALWVDPILYLIWASAAITLVLERRWAFVLSLLAAVTATAHGLLVAIGGSWSGSLFVAGAGAVFLFSFRQLGWGRRREVRKEQFVDKNRRAA